MNLSRVPLLLLFILLFTGSAFAQSARTGPLFSDGRIMGRVVDEAGQPIAGVDVAAWPLSQHSGTAQTQTDASGHYELTGLSYDQYQIRFYDPQRRFVTVYGGAADRDQAHYYDIDSNATVRVDATMQPGATLIGRVTRSNGAPSNYARVSAFRNVGGEWRAEGGQYPLNDGWFTIRALPAGEYIVEASEYIDFRETNVYYPDVSTQEEATRIRLDKGATRRGVYLVIEPVVPASVTVEGQVRGPQGQPLTGINAVLYSYQPGYSSWLRTADEKTGSDGRYRFSGYSPAYYKVGFEDPSEHYAPEFNNDQPTLGAAPHTYLEADAVLTVDAQLQVGGTLRGCITNPANETPQSLQTTVLRWNNHDAFLPVNNYYRWENNTRCFARSGLPTGIYRLQITTRYERESFSEWYGDAADAEDAATIAITAGQTVDLGTIMVAEDAATVSGIVRGADGQPLAGANVILQLGYTSGYFGDFARTVTDANGRYSFNQLEATSYKVRVEARDGRHRTTYYPNGRFQHDAAVIELTAGETRTADVALGLGGSISGSFRTTGGEPVEQGWVYVYAVDGDDLHYIDTISDVTIGYTITGLWPGEYVVLFSAISDRTPHRISEEWWQDSPARSQADRVTVVAGAETTGIDARVGNIASPHERTDGGISGRVVADDDGRPLAGIEVIAYELLFRGRSSHWQEAARTTTDAAGRYSFEGLRLGDYRLGFRDPDDRYLREYYNDRTEFDIAFVITLDPEQPQRPETIVGLGTNPAR